MSPYDLNPVGVRFQNPVVGKELAEGFAMLLVVLQDYCPSAIRATPGYGSLMRSGKRVFIAAIRWRRLREDGWAGLIAVCVFRSFISKSSQRSCTRGTRQAGCLGVLDMLRNLPEYRVIEIKSGSWNCILEYAAHKVVC
jgi:hypothetical protein